MYYVENLESSAHKSLLTLGYSEKSGAMNIFFFCITISMSVKTSVSYFSTGCNSCIIADNLVLRETRFDGDLIWSAGVSDLPACAKACMRLKPCASFNYDDPSSFCSLYTDTAEISPEYVSYGIGMMYSAIAGWPEALDPDCYSRPCAEDEVCVPGVVAQYIDNNCPPHSCSHTCLQFSPIKNTTETMVTPVSTTVTPSTTTSSQESITYQCPANWVLFDGNCYMFVTTGRSWSNSEAFCGAQGGYLAEVYNSWTNDFLVSLMGQYISGSESGPWIGANDLTLEGEWIWKQSGISLTYTNWAGAQPNGGTNENCVQYYQFNIPLWYDHMCTDLNPSVCQMVAIPSE